MWWGRQGFYARFPICFANLGYYHLPTVCTMPIKLRFNFSPILIIISCSRNASSLTTTSTIGIFVRNVHGMRLTQSTNYASRIVYATWAETSISWYSVDGENDQLNYDGTTYHYLAIG